MTGPTDEDQWPVGSVANYHLRTSGGWIPLTRKSRADGPPWVPGDVVDGHVMTEAGEWVSAGELAQAPVTAPLHPIAAPPMSPKERWLRLPIGAKIALAVLPVLVGLSVIGSVVGETDDRGTSEAPAPTPKAIPNAAKSQSPNPARTTVAPDPSIKYAADMKKLGWTKLTDGLWGKWDPSSSDSFSVTWNMRVVSQDGCSNGVYLEGNVMDASNTVVGFVNDMLPSLPANQQAVLKLMSTASGQLTVETTKANCY